MARCLPDEMSDMGISGKAMVVLINYYSKARSVRKEYYQSNASIWLQQSEVLRLVNFAFPSRFATSFRRHSLISHSPI